MPHVIEIINRLSLFWTYWMWSMSVQATLLAVIILVITAIFPKVPASFRYLLWLFLLLKLIFVPPWLTARWSIGNLLAKIPGYSHVCPSYPYRFHKKPVSIIINTDPFPEGPYRQSVIPGSDPERRFLAAVSGPRLTPFSFVMICWAAIAAAFFALIVSRYRNYTRQILRLISLPEKGALAILAERTGQLNIRRRVRLRFSPNAGTPALIGFFRAVIVLPQELQEPRLQSRLSDIIAHELAHLKRRDLQIGWLTLISTSLYWFLPVVWLANYYLSRERETACDDLVLSCRDPAVEKYADTLLWAAEHFRARAPAGVGYLGRLEFPGNLRFRFHSILDPGHARRISVKTVFFIFFFTLTCIPLGIAYQNSKLMEIMDAVRVRVFKIKMPDRAEPEEVRAEDEILKIYREYVEKYPADPEGYFLLGQYYYGTKRREQAIENYRLFLTFEGRVPLDPERRFYSWRNLSYLHQSNEDLDASFKDVETLWENGLAYDSEKHYDDVVVRYNHFRDPNAVCAHLQGLIAKFPDQPHILGILGNFLSQSRKYEEAIPVYERAIDRGRATPFVPAWQAKLILCRLNNGEIDRAREIIEKSAAESPNGYVSAFGSACLSERNGDIREAAREFDTACRAAKTKMEKTILLGKMVEFHSDVGNVDRAIGIFRELSELERPLTRYTRKMVDYCEINGRYQDAIDGNLEIIRRLPFFLETWGMTIDERYARCYREISRLQLKRGKRQEALETMMNCREKFPDKFFTHMGLAEYYRFVGNFDPAEAEYLKAFEIAGDSEIGDLIRMLSREAHRHEKAVAYARRLLERDPGDSKANQYLAEIYEDRGQYLEAARRYESIAAGFPPENLQFPYLITRAADCYSRAGRKDYAVKLATEALGKNDSASPLYICLGDFSFSAGDYEKAFSFYRQALSCASLNDRAAIRIKIIDASQRAIPNFQY